MSYDDDDDDDDNLHRSISSQSAQKATEFGEITQSLGLLRRSR